MRIAVCDDEKVFCQEVYNHIMLYRKNSQKDITIQLFQSGDDLLRSSQEFSMVLLDYEMKGINGMETARRLREKNKDVIIVFLTSHTEVMQEAFVVKAFRYMVKPITYQEIEACINAVREELEQEEELVFDDDIPKKIKLKHIVYIEAGNKGTCVRTSEGTYKSKNTMSDWESLLNDRYFYRCHKSYYINLAFVDKIYPEYVLLYNKEKVALSRRSRKEFQHRMNQFIKMKAR